MHYLGRWPIVLLFLLATIILGIGQDYPACAENVRPSPLAGGWYPDDPPRLTEMLREYLSKANPPATSRPVAALISPHAGYIYSGQAAAYGFKLIQGKKYDRVIVIAPSHYARFHGIAVSEYDVYKTPLGSVPVDKSVGDRLSINPLFRRNQSAEAREHAVEMQLPYLQLVLKEFSLVPLIVGDLREGEYEAAADQIKPFVTRDTLVVVSSDFTHYGARFRYIPFKAKVKENLHSLDMGSVKPILEKDCAGFTRYIQQTGITICGSAPIAVLIDLLPKEATGELLTYYTSGEITNDYSSAVSYCSIVFFGPSD